MTDTRWEADLQLALDIAAAADEISLSRFEAGDWVMETKSDLTPVTEVDRQVEQAVRARLAEERTEDGVMGEEFGGSTRSRRVWIVDPIDGTKNYVRGVPVFATLLALVVEGSPVVGVVSAPGLGRRWHAAAGLGAHRNGTPIHVSSIARLTEAHLSYDDRRSFTAHGLADGIERLENEVWRVRGFGDFWSHVLVAEGAVDVAVEPEVAPWDLAALQVVVEQAGGRFTDLSGRATFEGGSALSTNGLLHGAVLDRLGTPGVGTGVDEG